LYSYLKQKCLFSKMIDRKVKQVLSGGWSGRGRGGCKERAYIRWKYYVLMYENGKMRPFETPPGVSNSPPGRGGR
jgi:hypothetical protein